MTGATWRAWVGLALALAIVWPAVVSPSDAFRELDLLRLPSPKPAAEFTVPGLLERPIALRDFRGKVLFLNFWATWCPPCKEEMPSMERLYLRYKDRGLAMLAISIDAGDKAGVAAFVKKYGLTFTIGLDPSLEVANRYTVRALPSSFLIDKNGYIVAVALGPRDWDGTAAHAVIEGLLK